MASETETEGSDDAGVAGRFGWPTIDPEHREIAQSSSAVSFWGNPEDMSMVEVRPRLAVAADLILRQLDPSALGDARVIIDELRPLYERITSGAVGLAFDEDSNPPRS